MSSDAQALSQKPDLLGPPYPKGPLRRGQVLHCCCFSLCPHILPWQCRSESLPIVIKAVLCLYSHKYPPQKLSTLSKKRTKGNGLVNSRRAQDLISGRTCATTWAIRNTNGKGMRESPLLGGLSKKGASLTSLDTVSTAGEGSWWQLVASHPWGLRVSFMVKIIFQAKHQYLGVSLVSSRNTILRPLSRERKRIYRMVLLLLASLRQIIHFCLSGWLLLVMVINCLPVHSLTSWSYCFCFQKKKKTINISLNSIYNLWLLLSFFSGWNSIHRGYPLWSHAFTLLIGWGPVHWYTDEFHKREI